MKTGKHGHCRAAAAAAEGGVTGKSGQIVRNGRTANHQWPPDVGVNLGVQSVAISFAEERIKKGKGAW